MDVLAVVTVGIWAMLPAYIPNNVAVLTGGGPPIDGGRQFRGDRLLGDGKTWRGTVLGIAAGVLLAFLLNAVQEPVTSALGFPLPAFSGPATVALPTGALLGDIGASFLKRRTGRARGNPFPVVDQLDFVVVALLLTAAVDPAWFGQVFTLPVLLVVILLTPALHLATNGIAYLLDLKDEPW